MAHNFHLAPPEIVNTRKYNCSQLAASCSSVLSVLSEWCSLVGAGRRLGEITVWMTAVVDR